MYKFLCLLIIIVHITYSQINQFLALSGGTYGFGAKYSLFYKLVSADLGATFNYNFDNIDSTFVITSNRFELNQHFSLNMTIINKQEYNIKIGIIDLNRLTYEDTRQSINDSIYQIGPGFIFSTKIGPTFEFITWILH